MTIEELIKNIFYYIDTYYDDDKAIIVKKLIENYILSLNNGDSLTKGNKEV